MKKIELTPKTIGVIMDRLQRATSGQFLWETQRNQDPLKIKKFAHNRLEAVAEITIHWSYCKLNSSKKAVKHNTCLLHMFVNEGCQNYYTFGDVFYFKGKTILIDRKGRHDVGKSSLFQNTHRDVERITVIKYAKQLAQEDRDIANYRREIAEMEAKEYEKDYFKNYEEDFLLSIGDEQIEEITSDLQEITF